MPAQCQAMLTTHATICPNCHSLSSSPSGKPIVKHDCRRQNENDRFFCASARPRGGICTAVQRDAEETVGAESPYRLHHLQVSVCCVKRAAQPTMRNCFSSNRLLIWVLICRYRNRHVKCDEAKPSCRRCVTARFSCEYPRQRSHKPESLRPLRMAPLQETEPPGWDLAQGARYCSFSPSSSSCFFLSALSFVGHFLPSCFTAYAAEFESGANTCCPSRNGYEP